MVDTRDTTSTVAWVAEFRDDPFLPDPYCHASIIRCTRPDEGNVILFSNPSDKTKRHRMTVKASTDDCESWPVEKLIDAGMAGYSSLAVTDEGTILCAYERGDVSSRENIAVVRFNLSWLYAGNAADQS